MSVHYLAYASKISLLASFDSQCFHKICEQSNHHNSEVGITGFLCFKSGYFFQYIEGGQAAIEDLVQRLKQDNRHHHFTLLQEGQNDKRLFANWKMFCINPDDNQVDERISGEFENFYPLSWQSEQVEALISAFLRYYQSPNHPVNYGFEPIKTSYCFHATHALVSRHQVFVALQILIILVSLLAVSWMLW